ncbi:MAG: GYF domain-containing protein [Candidatus Sumerlaeaceae bacterium]
MVWYYAEGGEQRGPISDSELDEMIANARISHETLVWRDGMDNWQPLETVRTPPAPGSPPLPSSYPEGLSAPVSPSLGASISYLAMCHNCGANLPPESLTRIGNIRLCASCLPSFVQQVRQYEGRAAQAATVSVRYGGFWIRALAKSVDHLLISILLAPLSLKMMPEDLPDKVFALLFRSVGDPEPLLKQLEQYSAGFFPYIISALVVYNAVFVALMSATPGKYLSGIKVISADGARVSFAQAVARAVIPALLLIADQFGAFGIGRIVVMAGYLMVAFDVEKRSLFDRICRTRVVRTR